MSRPTARTVAAGKLLRAFDAVGGFQLPLERSQAARAGILLNPLRAAPLAGEGMRGALHFSSSQGFCLGLLFPPQGSQDGQNGFLAAAPVGPKAGNRGLSSKLAITLL